MRQGEGGHLESAGVEDRRFDQRRRWWRCQPLFVWATCSAPGIWGRVLFSMHMVMHMAVAMTVPLFLVPGAP